MKKNILLFILSLSVLFINISCVEEDPKGVSFDKTAFSEQKEKWLSSKPESYSFVYSFSTYMPNYVVGNVSVTKDTSTASILLLKDTEIESELESSSKYYLDSVEDVFDFIYSEYERALKTVESGDYEYIEIKVKYNETYGYPEYISNPGSGGKKDIKDKTNLLIGYSSEDYSFTMTNFSAEQDTSEN